MLSIIKLMQLLGAVERVDGRKKLQKMVHILQELGYPFDERFEYSYYGMYSVDLRNEVDQLVSEDILGEEPVTYAHDRTTYTTRATEKLRELLAQHQLDQEEAWTALARKLNEYSAVELEGISTVLFLYRRGYRGDDRCQRLVELKPHLSERAKWCCKEADQLQTKALAS